MSFEAPLRETPNLERLLNRMGRELRLQVWMHGLGTVLLVAALWCVWTFVADWGLSVPRPMRMLNALLLVCLPVWFVWRSWLRPLRSVPDRAGLAILPTLDGERLVAEGALTRVLPGHEQEGATVSLVWPAARYLAPRVRAFIDHAVGSLSEGAPGP